MRTLLVAFVLQAMLLVTACGSLGFLGLGKDKEAATNRSADEGSSAPSMVPGPARNQDGTEADAVVVGSEGTPSRSPSASGLDRPRMEVTHLRVDEPSDQTQEHGESPAILPSETQPILVPANLRVGLASDRVAIEVTCCKDPVRLLNQAAHFDLESAAVVTPLLRDGSGAQAPSLFFLQAAALKDQQQAHAVARRLAAALGTLAAAVFDAQADLYKVRVGPLPSRAEAEALKPQLLKLGYREPWILREANADSWVGFEVAVRVAGERRVVRFEGRHLLLERQSGTVRFGDSVYRGKLLLFVNDRGQINVINDIGFEDYLRGVVPMELGPGQYPELEALKAQAIAARTYTLKNLGEFLAEGYDICSTPRCQVYGGQTAEHPLSDRAIAETEGQILVATRGGVTGGDGQTAEIVDAMFSASCGGHTENVNSIFPLKSEFYLAARPCIEGGLKDIGTASAGVGSRTFAATLIDSLGGAVDPGGSGADRFQAKLLTLARAARLAVPRDRLQTLEAHEVTRYLGSVFDLVLDRRWFDPASTEHHAALADPAISGLAQALADLSGLRADAEVNQKLRSRLIAGLAQALRLAEFLPARFFESAGHGFKVDEGGAPRTIGDDVPVFVRAPGGVGPAARISSYPGGPLELVQVAGGQVVAVISDHEGHGRRPTLARKWTRFRSKQRLQELVAARYPGFQLADIEIGERGESSRVERLTLVGASGKRETVRGLEVRWVLDLPDTWFSAQPSQRNGARGWLFTGRGRGHGVGMCQVGAYGMAVMGAKYRDILEHYYSGARVVESREDSPTTPWTVRSR